MKYKILFLFTFTLSIINLLSAQNFSKEEIKANKNAPYFVLLTIVDTPNINNIKTAFNYYLKNRKNIPKQVEGQEETDIWEAYYKRWMQKVKNYVMPNGDVILNTPNLYLEKRSEFKEKESQKKTRAIGWRLIGPKNLINNNGDDENGNTNMYSVSFNKSDSLIGYATTETGYYFKTIDGGNTWNSIANNTILGGGRSIESIPSNPNVVIASGGNSIYKSIDGGLNFILLNTINAGIIWRYLINPLNENSMIIATDNGLYQSYNGGNSWQLRQTGKINGVEYKTNDTSVIFAFAVNSNPTSNFPSGNYNAFVYKSINGGQTFTSKPIGFTNFSTNKFTYICGDVTVTEANPNMLYALVLASVEDANATSISSGLEGVYMSIDAGETWNKMHGYPTNPNLATFGPSANYIAYWQGDYNNWIIANKNNAAEIIVGCLTTYKSVDSGKTYTPILGYSGTLGRHPDCQNFTYNNNALWICNDGGLLKSYDFCTTQPATKNNGIWAAQYWGLGMNNNYPIYTGGKYHNGNSAYFDIGNNDGIFYSLGGGESATGYVRENDSIVYHSDIGAKKISSNRSTPFSGATNIALFPNESYGNVIDKSDIIYHPNYSNILFLGNDTILWKSIDNGISFNQLASFSNEVRDIEICHNSPDTMYVTTNSNQIFVSTNAGNNFTNITGTLGNFNKTIAVNPSNPKQIWVLKVNSDEVYKSDNLGVTWSLNVGSTGGLQNKQGMDIICSPNASNPTISVFTQHYGVAYKNISNNWALLSQDLPAYAPYRKMYPNYRQNKYVVAMDGGGLWEHDFMFPQQPLANFSIDKQQLNCLKDTVQYFDNSYSETNVTRAWNFPGSIWTSSLTDRNPKVLYNALGNYNATLTVTNANGSNTKNINSILQITSNICIADSIPGLAISSKNANFSSIPLGKPSINGNNFSIMFWVKPTQLQTSFSQILSTVNGSVDRFGIGFTFNGYTPNLNLTYTHSSSNYWDATSIFLDSNKWNHITFTYSPTEIKIYLNGQTPWVKTGNFPVVNFSNTEFAVNEDIHNQGGDFKGELDEIAFYNTTLTIDSIRSKMHLFRKVSEPNLVHSIQFNQFAGNTLYDINGNNLGIASSANFVKSDAPFGPGVIDKVSITGATNYSYPNTGIDIQFTNATAPTTGEIVITKININPDTLPNGITINPLKSYYAINNFTDINSFSNLVKMQFNKLPISLASSSTNVNDYKLFTREIGDYSQPRWINKDISSNFTITSNEVQIQFNTNNSIQKFGQFMVSTSQTPSGLIEPNINSIFCKIYPNPANEFLFIDVLNRFTSKINILITDALGKCVIQTSSNNFPNTKIMIPIAGLTNGIYFIKIVDEKFNTISTKKFIKQDN